MAILELTGESVIALWLRRNSALLFLALSQFAPISGCSDHGSPAAEPESGIVHLTYWPAPNPEEIRLADTLVKVWNATHPRIQVRMQAIPVSQSTEEVLLAAIAGKTTPDVCSNIWPGALHEFMHSGGLLALDEFPGFDSVASSRTPRDLLETFKSGEDHYYQIPWKTNPIMMFYNVRMFNEAGIERPPRTYSEFFRDGQKLTRDLDGDGQVDVWIGERDIRPIWWQRLFDFYPFYIAASNGKTLFEKGDVAIATAPAAEVLSFFQTCYQKGFFPRTFFQGGDPFLLEKKATHFAGPWEIATAQKLAPNLRFGVAPLPVPDNHQGPVFTYGDYKNIAIFSTTRHPREAWEFVKFLLTPEHDLLLLEITHQVPVRGDLLSNPVFSRFFRQNPMMVTFAKQAVYTRSVDSAPDLKEIFDGISQEYEACAVYGAEDGTQAVESILKRTHLIVEWNR